VISDLQGRAKAGWLPVVVTGLVLLGSVPLYADVLPRRFADYAPLSAGPTAFFSPGGGRLGRLAGGGPSVLGRYWLVVVPAVYLLLAAWFALRARRTGLQQRWTVYIGVGLALFAVLLLTVLPVSDPLPVVVREVATPLLLLAGSLAVLGAVEQDRRLMVLAAVGAGVAVYVGLTIRGGFVLPDSVPGEPVLSGLLSAQGAVAVLGVSFVVCGLAWRPWRK
jgi:hypothetical protein